VRTRGQQGAAVADFVLVAPMLLFLFLGLVQVALVLFARNVLVADAAEGAREAANVSASPASGDGRCAAFIRSSLSGALAQDAVCSSSLQPGPAGLEVTTVVRAVIPLVVVPFGRLHLTVAAHALDEPAPQAPP
jgi:Flp pilus assembly protein TadG